MAELHDTAVVTGMSALGDKLKTLPAKVRDKVARAALLEAAKTGLAAVETEVPYRTGNLYRHLRFAFKKQPEDTRISYVVFVKTGGKGQRGGGSRRLHGPSEPSGTTAPYYWFMVEFGTSHMAANPFMLRGYEKSADNAATRARDIAANKLKDVVA